LLNYNNILHINTISVFYLYCKYLLRLNILKIIWLNTSHKEVIYFSLLLVLFLIIIIILIYYIKIKILIFTLLFIRKKKN